MPTSTETFEREQRRVKEAVRRGVAASANALGSEPSPGRLGDRVVDELHDRVRGLRARG